MVRRTSCDMGISSGEEWLIFAYQTNDSTLQTGHCTFSIKYSTSSGERDWFDERAFTRIAKVKDILGIESNSEEILNGEFIEKYPNGSIEIESFYKNGLLEGERSIWYSNGQLRSIEFFMHGKRNGKSIWYYPNGDLRKDYTYSNHKPIYSCLDFWPNNQLAILEVYSSTGIDYVSTTFSKQGTKTSESFTDTLTNTLRHKRYYAKGEIESETIRQPKSSSKTHFYKDGKIKSLSLEFKEGTIESELKTWDEKGELIYHMQYDREHKKIVIFDSKKD
jgi:antitoxin component YwqK of YwqJK toxin-antitoxin module